jgi:UDP-N-acetyl-D-glucosamine dehydrogenase
MTLPERIASREATVGVIGLGYVGLPLVMEFCRAGFRVTGFDVDQRKVDRLAAGESYIKHIPGEKIAALRSSGLFEPTVDFSRLTGTDCIVICVPTPLDAHRDPDMSYVFETTRTVARYLRRGHLVVLESTTYPGTTDEDMRPILEKGGLAAGVDFHLAFSPEREDPNNRDFNTSTIPKVVGGYTPACLEAALALYDAIVVRTVPVSSTRVAEASKLLENIYRGVNIALVNELKVLFDRMGIDVWEVIEAARTKPFGFQAFYPGPGLGGHCIPIDPFYLTWKAHEYEMSTRFIELAGEINLAMPRYVVDRTAEALNRDRKALNGAFLVILGVAYKRDVDDQRESPALKIIELFQERGAEVVYHDPWIPRSSGHRKYPGHDMESVPLTAELLGRADAVVLVTDHADFDYPFIERHARLIVDTRNAFERAGVKSPKVTKA